MEHRWSVRVVSQVTALASMFIGGCIETNSDPHRPFDNAAQASPDPMWISVTFAEQFGQAWMTRVSEQHHSDPSCKNASWLFLDAADPPQDQWSVYLRIRLEEALSPGMRDDVIGGPHSLGERVTIKPADGTSAHLKFVTMDVERWDDDGFALLFSGGITCPNNDHEGPDCAPFEGTLHIESAEPPTQPIGPPVRYCYDSGSPTSDGYCEPADNDDDPVPCGDAAIP